MELSELPSKLQQCLRFAQPTCGWVECKNKGALVRGLDAFIILLFGCNFSSLCPRSLRFLTTLPRRGPVALGAVTVCDSDAHQALLSSFVEITVPKLYCEKCMNILFELGVYSNYVWHKLMELKPTILIQQNMKKIRGT